MSVTDAQGFEVAGRDGFGTTVDWTWDSARTPAGRVRVGDRRRAERPAGHGHVRPGSACRGAARARRDVSAQPEAISPNDDGQAD